ncbi:MAG: hypothetical protein U0M40_04985, partial [Christensenellales bacterium]
LPARGAWIEMILLILLYFLLLSLPARGAWIEIKHMLSIPQEWIGRSPHGERGLKLLHLSPFLALCTVAPRTGSVD